MAMTIIGEKTLDTDYELTPEEKREDSQDEDIQYLYAMIHMFQEANGSHRKWMLRIIDIMEKQNERIAKIEARLNRKKAGKKKKR